MNKDAEERIRAAVKRTGGYTRSVLHSDLCELITELDERREEITLLTNERNETREVLLKTTKAHMTDMAKLSKNSVTGRYSSKVKDILMKKL